MPVIMYSKGQNFSAGGGGGVVDPTSVDLDTTEFFRNNTNQTYGFGDEWTWAVWFNAAGVFASNRFIFNIAAQTSNNDGIRLQTRSGNDMLVNLRNSSGTFFKSYQYNNSEPSTGNWHLYILSWDGTDVQFSIDDVEQTDITKFTDDVDGQTDSSKVLTIGNLNVEGTSLAGLYHSIAVWNVALDADNRTGIFASGNEIDWQVNQGTYTQAANMPHYWRLGLDDSSDSNMGKDYVGTINVMDDANAITTDDIVTDAPGA